MPNRRRFLLIVNPTSGRGRARRTAAAVTHDLRRRGCDTTIVETSARGDAEALVAEALRNPAGKPDCIVACGGDGTIQGIAHALALSRVSAPKAGAPALGLAPTGRCNDFARALGVPTEASAIAEILDKGDPVATDLASVNGRHFCTVATLGIDAEVTGFVDAMRIPLTGTPAYLYGALRVLMRYRAPRVRIRGDFGLIDGDVFLASSANTSSYGGGIPIAPDADPRDGLVDLCVIERMSKLSALRLIPIVLAARHTTLPEVRIERAARFTIESDEPLELWADGERIGQTPATIKAVPRAVRVLLSY